MPLEGLPQGTKRVGLNTLETIMNFRTLSIAAALIGAVSIASAAEGATAPASAASAVKHAAHKSASAASETVSK